MILLNIMIKISGKIFVYNRYIQKMDNRYRGRGRLRREFVEGMIRQADCNRYVDMKRLAINREKWRTRFAATRQGL